MDFVLKDPREKEDEKKEKLPPHREELAVVPKPWNKAYVAAQEIAGDILHVTNPCMMQVRTGHGPEMSTISLSPLTFHKESGAGFGIHCMFNTYNANNGSLNVKVLPSTPDTKYATTIYHLMKIVILLIQKGKTNQLFSFSSVT